MRQLATLPERDAQKLGDYLLTLKIETQLIPEGASWGVWVRDEDQLPKARSELAEFLKDPAASRYAGAAKAALDIRRREEQETDAFEKRQTDLAARMARNMSGGRPFVTLGLVLASLAVSVASGTVFLVGSIQEKDLNNRVLQAVLIQPLKPDEPHQPGLSEVKKGEVWRLVTPIFLHFGPLHLLFNLLMLRDLGGAVESRRGSLRMLGLVLVLAVPSNLAQYYFGSTLKAVDGSPMGPNPLFGGMSGVLYGLFGYMWMKSRFAPEMGLAMQPTMVAFMIAWFFLCMTPAVSHVANVAHAAGLVLGIVFGAGPHLLQRTWGDG